jgi:hypothetical protein
MDQEFLQAVRENLLSLGYEKLSDALVEEFAQRLQQDEGFALSPTEHNEFVCGAEEEPEFRPKTIPSPARKSGGRVDDLGDEITQWSKKLKSIENKAQNLDSQIRQCKSAIIDSAAGETQYTDVSLYYGNAECGLDPYPAVKRKISGGGGFIRPPPVRTSRRQVGKNAHTGKRLLYEQRFPDYVPPPERRRDALRWRIRQQIEYSDPRYHQ